MMDRSGVSFQSIGEGIFLVNGVSVSPRTGLYVMRAETRKKSANLGRVIVRQPHAEMQRKHLK